MSPDEGIDRLAALERVAVAAREWTEIGEDDDFAKPVCDNLVEAVRALDGKDRHGRTAASVEAGPSRGLRPLTPEEQRVEQMRTVRDWAHDCADTSEANYKAKSNGDDYDQDIAPSLAARGRAFRECADKINGLLALPLPPQADAKVIPSPAPQAPPPEGIEDSDLDSTSVLGAMRGFLADHTRPNGSIAKDVSMHLRPSTVGCVLQIVALRTAERDAAIARAERAENALWAQTKSYEGACARADKLAAIVKANASGAVAYAEMEGKLAAAQAERDRMREALASIANNSCCGPCQEAKLVASAALTHAPGGSSGEA